MTNKQIEHYGSSAKAAAAFKNVTLVDMISASRILKPVAYDSRTYNTIVRQISNERITIPDLSKWTDNQVKRNVVGLGKSGIPFLDILLKTAKKQQSRRFRDAWSHAHHGLVHPDDKIQAV